MVCLCGTCKDCKYVKKWKEVPWRELPCTEKRLIVDTFLFHGLTSSLIKRENCFSVSIFRFILQYF